MKTRLLIGTTAAAACLAMASTRVVHADRDLLRASRIQLPAAGTDAELPPDTLRGEITVRDPETLRFNPDWDFSKVDVVFADTALSDLRKDVDYTVAVSHNYDLGSATLTVKGIGKYTGTLSLPVEITRGIIDPVKAFGIDPNQDLTYTGYDIYPYVCYLDNFVSGGCQFSFQFVADVDGIYLDEPREVEYLNEPGTYRMMAECEECYWYEALPKSAGQEFMVHPLDNEQMYMVEEILRDLEERNGYRRPSVNDYYPEGSKYRYDSYLEFFNGRIVGIHLDGRDPLVNEMQGDADAFPYRLFEIPTLRRLRLPYCNLNTDLMKIAEGFMRDHTLAEAARQLEALDLPGNNLTGDLGVISRLFPNLKQLNLDDNALTSISVPLPETLRDFSYRIQRSDISLDLDFTSLDFEKLKSQIPTLALYYPYDHGFTDHLNITISEDPEFHGDYGHFGLSTNIWFDGLSLQFDQPYFFGNGTYRGPLETTLYLSAGSYYSSYDGIRMTANVRFIPYDLNFDFKMNVADIQSLINYILYSDGYTLFNFTQADLNTDDRVNAQDLVKMTNLMLAMAAQPFSTAAEEKIFRAPAADGSEPEAAPRANVSVADGAVYLQSDCDVAAIDLAFYGSAPQLTSALKDAGFTVTARSEGSTHRLIAYSTTGAVLPAGRHCLATGFAGSLTGGSLSDIKARQIPLSCDIPTGIDTVETDKVITAARLSDAIRLTAGAPAEWHLYDMAGILIGSGSAETGSTMIDLPAGSHAILTVSSAGENESFKF